MIDAKAALAGLKALETALLSNVRQALGQSAAYTAQVARSTTTFKDRSGGLRASVKRVERSEWHQQVSAGGPGARHALFVEAGTKPHPIVARRAQFLRFEQHGAIRYARRVFHPGTKATNFMLNARDLGEAQLAVFIDRGVSTAIG